MAVKAILKAGQPGPNKHKNPSRVLNKQTQPLNPSVGYCIHSVTALRIDLRAREAERVQNSNKGLKLKTAWCEFQEKIKETSSLSDR